MIGPKIRWFINAAQSWTPLPIGTVEEL